MSNDYVISAGITKFSDIEEQAFNRFGMEIVGSNARAVYEKAGLSREDLDMVETHDCFLAAEILACEELGLSPMGEGGRFCDEGATRIGGRTPVNPSGGLLAKGHPPGATGLARVGEIVTRLRGEEGARQVEGARVGATSNMGMWSCCIHVPAI